jgi:hypothetical protein
MNGDQHDTVIREKHYRMTLDFRVLIGEVEEVIRDGDDAEHAREHRERQERLLRALLSNERVLGEFMTYLVTDRVCGHTDSELDKVFGVRPEEEMLEPVYSGMGEDDARFFREVKDNGLFWDNTEQFEWCFAVDWTGANLVEIKAERQGDTSAAERGHPDMSRFTK